MITAAQIAQGAITDTKVGKNANIKHSKLEKAGEGEVLVAQEDGRLKAVRVTGDARLSRSGKLTINLPESGEQSIVDTSKLVQKSDLKEGKTLVGGATRPEEVAVGSGSNAIPQRDSSGNLKAETADNADKLDNQEGAYYTNVDNHVYPTPTTTTSNGNSTTTTSSAPKVIEFVPNTSNYPCSFSHTFGYIPDVTVFKNNSGTYEMIDAQVTATSSNVTVNVSDPSISTRIVAK
tara:strand:+ start:5207 stop:5908 length:702 start_codon:yes stop_codon:yes gene_type:complete